MLVRTIKSDNSERRHESMETLLYCYVINNGFKLQENLNSKKIDRKIKIIQTNPKYNMNVFYECSFSIDKKRKVLKEKTLKEIFIFILKAMRT